MTTHVEDVRHFTELGVAGERFKFSTEGAESNARAVIAGYQRVGHAVGTILKSSGIPFIAFDTK